LPASSSHCPLPRLEPALDVHELSLGRVQAPVSMPPWSGLAALAAKVKEMRDELQVVPPRLPVLRQGEDVQIR
jgi:hypothetical protein